MSAKVMWGYDPSVAVTSWVLAKSTDKGVSFAPLVTLAWDTSTASASYAAATKTFYYVDGAANPGDIISVVSVGANGTSQPVFTVVPPTAPPVCTVMGYVADAFGYVDTRMQVVVEAYGTKGERWLESPGTMAQNPQALGISYGKRVVFPDVNGMWQVDLMQGAFARISIQALELDWCFETPALAIANIRDIRCLRGPDRGIFGEENGVRNVYPRG